MANFSGWRTYDSSPLMEPEYYKLLRKIILIENNTAVKALTKQNIQRLNGKFKKITYLEYWNWNTKPALTTKEIIMETF